MKLIKIIEILIIFTIIFNFTFIKEIYADDDMEFMQEAPEETQKQEIPSSGDTKKQEDSSTGEKEKSGESKKAGITTLDNVITGADDFLKAGENAKDDDGNPINTINITELQDSSKKIFNILFAIGVAITVVIGGILGIKFIMASAEDKAQIKEMLLPYIIGCIVIYGAFGIWKLTVEILQAI